MITMKKIMFSDKYCQTAAVISETKTMFRRLVPNKAFDAWNDIDDGDEYSRSVYAGSNDAKMRNFLLEYSQYKVGEKVSVAQCYRHIYCQEPAERLSEEYSMWFLKQRGLTDTKGWKNKMFVKADWMPHQIEITDIRVQRLQDISDDNCFKEGIEYNGMFYSFEGTNDGFLEAREAYAALIDQISGKGTWERNPFVFCYTFKLVK